MFNYVITYTENNFALLLCTVDFHHSNTGRTEEEEEEELQLLQSWKSNTLFFLPPSREKDTIVV